MLKLPFEIALLLYLVVSIFGFLAAWILFSQIKLPTQETTKLESIWQCAICTYIYVDSKNKKLSLCPRCGSYNEREIKGGGH